MPETNNEIVRKFAVILAADVVGYSSLMERDEEGTHRTLRAFIQDFLKPTIALHRGRIFKTLGDGLIVEFDSPIEAVRCAAEMQGLTGSRMDQSVTSKTTRLPMRIGINVGDVLSETDDLYGDGVNVAVRLESQAEPNGVHISGTMFELVDGKTNLRFEDLGPRTYKNLARPIRVYRVSGVAAATTSVEASEQSQGTQASIAVLPFANMSSDAEQEFFADGLTEDLITDLSKVPNLIVIARNSTFMYKGKAVDIRAVGRDLGVRYVVEGSVRRAAKRVRITIQLIEAANGSHLCADRFDRDLDDVFALQDEVVARLVEVLSNALPIGKLKETKRANNVEAYDSFIKGRSLVLSSVEDNRLASQYLEKAIALDPEFADAHAWLALFYLFEGEIWSDEIRKHRQLAFSSAQRAVNLDPGNSDAHMILGYVHCYEGNLSTSKQLFDRALALNPNHADAHALMADLFVFDGTPQKAIESVRHGLRLNPHPPGWYYWLLGFAQFAAGEYRDAVVSLMNQSTRNTGSQNLLAASLVQIGEVDQAKVIAHEFMRLFPNFTVSSWAARQAFRDQNALATFVEAQERAGLRI